jgi:hypothetical protein
MSKFDSQASHKYGSFRAQDLFSTMFPNVEPAIIVKPIEPVIEPIVESIIEPIIEMDELFSEKQEVFIEHNPSFNEKLVNALKSEKGADQFRNAVDQLLFKIKKDKKEKW